MASMTSGFGPSATSYPNALAHLKTGMGQALPGYNYDATYTQPHPMARQINLEVNGGQYPVYLHNEESFTGAYDMLFIEDKLRQMIDYFQTEVQFHFFTDEGVQGLMSQLFPLSQRQLPVDAEYSVITVLPFKAVEMGSELTVRNVKINREKRKVTWGHQGLGYRQHIDRVGTPEGNEERRIHQEQVVKSMWMMMHLGRMSALVDGAKTPAMRTLFNPANFKTSENMIQMVEYMFGAMNKREFGIEYVTEMARQFRKKAGSAPIDMILVPEGSKTTIAFATDFRLIASNVGTNEARRTRNEGSEAIYGIGNIPIIEIGTERFQNVNSDQDTSMLENECHIGEFYLAANKHNPARNWNNRPTYDPKVARAVGVLNFSSSHMGYEMIEIEDIINNAQCWAANGLPDFDNLQVMLNDLELEVKARGDMEFAKDALGRSLIDPNVTYDRERKRALVHLYGQRMLAYSPESDLDTLGEVDARTIKHTLGEEGTRDFLRLLQIKEDLRSNSIGPKVNGVSHPLDQMARAIAASAANAGRRGLSPGNIFGSEDLPEVAEVGGNWVYTALRGAGVANAVMANFPAGFSTFHAMKYIFSLGPTVKGWYAINPKLFDEIRAGMIAYYALEKKMVDAFHNEQAPHYFMGAHNTILPFFHSLEGTTADQKMSTFMEILFGKVDYPIAIDAVAGGAALRAAPTDQNEWLIYVQPEVLSYASIWRRKPEDLPPLLAKNFEGQLQRTRPAAVILNALFKAYKDNNNKPIELSDDAGVRGAEIIQLVARHQRYAEVSYPDELPGGVGQNANQLILRLGVSRGYFNALPNDTDSVLYPANPQDGGYTALERLAYSGGLDAERYRAQGHAQAAWEEPFSADSNAAFLGTTQRVPPAGTAWTAESYGEMQGLTLDPLSERLAKQNPDLFTRLKYIDECIPDRLARACALAYCFARVSRTIELGWVKKKLYLPTDYIGLRPFMHVRMGSFFYVSRNIGMSLYSRTKTTTAYNVYLGDIQVSLDMFVANHVTQPQNITIMHQCIFRGYFGGGSNTIVPPMWRMQAQNNYESIFDASHVEARTGDIFFTCCGNANLVMNIVDITGSNHKIGLYGDSVKQQSFPGALAFSMTTKNIHLLEGASEWLISERYFNELRNIKRDNTTCWPGATQVLDPLGEARQRTYSAGPLSGVTPGCNKAMAGLERFGVLDPIVYGL